MPKFGKQSQERLATCHSNIVKLMYTVVEFYDITILCGYRNEGEQELAFANGKSKAKFGHSPHNHFSALAVDIAPYQAGVGIPLHDGQWDKDQFIFMAGIVLAKADELGIDITWGGDWNKNQLVIRDQSFNDLPHFQITNWKELI